MLSCSHRRTSFPQTPLPKPRNGVLPRAHQGTYVTCLRCGRSFTYNWDEMRIEIPTFWGRIKAMFVKPPEESPADVR